MPVMPVTAGRFGSLLREFRLRSGLTQQELADLSALSVRALRDLEAGRVHHPRRETVRLLSSALRLEGDRSAAFEQAWAPTGGESAGESDAVRPWSLPRPPTPSTASAAPAASAARTGTSLGRERELAALVDLLLSAGPGQLTVSGLPGVGKTRLVADAADRLRTGHGWEVSWATPEALRAGGPPEPIPVSSCGGSLLVVDGCDDLAPDSWGATLAGLRLRHPHRRVVATGRAPVGLPGERVMPLAPLPVRLAVPNGDPGGLLDQPAVRLFLSHVRRSQPGFQPSAADAPLLAELCHLLDGLPLALECAADWCLILPLRQLAEWARADPLAVADPPLPVDERRTLAAALRAAADALPQGRRALLHQLAGQDREWTLAAVGRAVGGSPARCAQDLHALVQCGLLQVWPPQDAHGFRVPRLVAHALAEVPATAGGLPVQLPDQGESCA
ncbi:transcriptional regulator with XRE-family HTH domain [Streptacidiphilus sp. MAP12-16]|uniref:helix-turn-helix domain-containing protein n=1 Tax=Streptacidiphilus sp. MAP12-16 TaxID=3156300 RepID=UPI00351929C0